MLEANMRIRERLSTKPLFFAGQLTGVEGYVESSAMGHIAGTNAARLVRGEDTITMPHGTMMGALAHYITTKEGTLQPINSNWGLVPAVPKKENGRRLSKPERRQRQAQRRSLCSMSSCARVKRPPFIGACQEHDYASGNRRTNMTELTLEPGVLRVASAFPDPPFEVTIEGRKTVLTPN